MSPRGVRSLVAVSATGATAAAAVLALLRASLAHHVGTVATAGGLALPQLSQRLAPLVGSGFAGSGGALATVVWAALVLAPPLLAMWACRATAPEHAALRWLLALAAWAPALGLVAAATALAMWLPFQNL